MAKKPGGQPGNKNAAKNSVARGIAARSRLAENASMKKFATPTSKLLSAGAKRLGENSYGGKLLRAGALIETTSHVLMSGKRKELMAMPEVKRMNNAKANAKKAEAAYNASIKKKK
jgi:hypothetical protein